jgi:hypothetical protein
LKENNVLSLVESDPKHRRFCVRCVAVVAVLAGSSSVLAQNRVANSTFDSGLSSWTAFGSAASDPVGTGAANWTGTRNLDNVPGSGSSDTTLTGVAARPANASFGIRQCITLPGAPVNVTEANYQASFLARATGNPTDGRGNATVQVRFFSDASCATFIPGSGGSQGVNLTSGAILNDAQWWTIGDPQFLPPGGGIVASSAEVSAVVRTVNTTSNGYEVFFDQIILSINGTTPVELSRFEIE